MRRVVMNLFIFFVFADHTDGNCRWKQWEFVSSLETVCEAAWECYVNVNSVEQKYPER